ncbi:hypothetical protein I552_5400 [Mycobacterium xenopi 3993]|nr:hypothetical protein I552_5400 [Mycobacterium xenopi 3993]
MALVRCGGRRRHRGRGLFGPQQPERTPEVTVRWVGATLHDPLWSYRTHALIGLTADGRLAEVSDPLSPSMRRRCSPANAGRAQPADQPHRRPPPVRAAAQP